MEKNYVEAQQEESVNAAPDSPDIVVQEDGTAVADAGTARKKPSKNNTVWKRIIRRWDMYLMMVPGLVCLLIFAYGPMYGIIIAWKDYKPYLGIMDSPWIGWDNFYYAVMSRGFLKLVRNTLILGLLKMIFAFPSSIILALMLNELRLRWFKKFVQTVSYLPYFISWVIINGMLYLFLQKDYGLLNQFLVNLGLDPVFWYAEPNYWRAILTITNIWKNCGWGTIVFLAAFTNISPDLYEAASIDGGGRWKQTVHISIPGIMPTIAITFVLSISGLVKDDFEQIYALVGTNSLLYEKVDVISTWVYRNLSNASFESYGSGTAVNLIQSLLAMTLTLGSNFLVRRFGQEGIF